MKKIFAIILSAMLLLSMTACGGGGEKEAETIKVGILGPHTGELAVYGLAVRYGAEMYFKQVNDAGGVNGKMIEVVNYDDQGDATMAVTGFTSLVDDGIVALVGEVTTGNCRAVVDEAYPINMPMVTASATATSITYDEETKTVFKNVFRTCFIDAYQGSKMADFASKELGAKKAAVLYLSGDDYTQGLAEAFEAQCKEMGVEVVAKEAFSKGDKDFNAQLTTIMAANPDVVFLPNYYEDDGMIVTQARALGIKCTLLGGDGWAGIEKYASAADLAGCYYASAYAAGSTAELKAFEEAFVAAYGEDYLNMFAATAYDAAMVVVEGLKAAEAKGAKAGEEDYKQAVIDGIDQNAGNVKGITSPSGYKFDEYNNPEKDVVIMTIKDVEGVPTPTYHMNY
ncbi:MAG: ABC transporter substrate-binding protein [Eubacteriaceae bacterium]|nr:ABC transporter substrate-binding protein [Eubacteriaceae bacterium]